MVIIVLVGLVGEIERRSFALSGMTDIYFCSVVFNSVVVRLMNLSDHLFVLFELTNRTVREET